MAHDAGAHGSDKWIPELQRLIDEQPEPADIPAAIRSLAVVGVDVKAVQDEVDAYLNLAKADWHEHDWRHSHPEFPAKYAAAAHIYTSEKLGIYSLLGDAMHDAQRAKYIVHEQRPEISAKLTACLPFIKLLDVALVEAAIFWGFFKGQTLRGVKYAYPKPTAAEHNPEEHFEKDREFHWFEFKSSSTDHSVMERPWFAGVKGPRTIFTIQSVEGVHVKRFSSFPDEEEVLFRPLARFKVTGCTKMLTPAALHPDAPGLPDTVQLQQLPTFDPMAVLRERAEQSRQQAQEAKQARAALLKLVGLDPDAVSKGLCSLLSLIFTATSKDISLSEGGQLIKQERARPDGPNCVDACNALCGGDQAMVRGRHYAEFEVLNMGLYPGVNRYPSSVVLGVAVESGLDLERGARMQVGFWGVWYDQGRLRWSETGSDRQFTDWEGQEGFHEGDTIGLLLDCDAGSLTVYKNGDQLGVAVKDGKYGLREAVHGGLCWCVDQRDSSVRVMRKPLPSTSA